MSSVSNGDVTGIMCLSIEVFFINLSRSSDRHFVTLTDVVDSKTCSYAFKLPLRLEKQVSTYKCALSTEYDLIQMLTIKQQHYEVISVKQMW